MKALAVIPARGGSKGVPRKNVRMLAGKPLLAWSIEAAQPPTCWVDRVVVSTEDREIAEVAAGYGAEVIERPDHLATDDAPTDGVLLHAVNALAERGYWPDLVVLLQPTVPVREPGLVDRCVEHLIMTDADSLLTAYPLHFVWWQESPAYRDAGTTSRPDPPGWRSQCPRRPPRQAMHSRELMWHEDGSVFVCKTQLLAATRSRIGGRIEVFETRRTVDIDTEEDFQVAEALMAAAVPA